MTARRQETSKPKPKRRPLTEAEKKARSRAMAEGREKKARARAREEARHRKEELTTIEVRIARASKAYSKAFRDAVRATKADDIKRLFDIADRRQSMLIGLLERQRQLLP